MCARERGEQPIRLDAGAAVRRGASEARCDGGRVDAEAFGVGLPLLSECVGLHAVVLGLTGLEGRDLRRSSRRRSGFRHRGLDLLAAPREVTDQLRGYAEYLSRALHHRSELQAEPRREEVAEVCLVKVAGGAGVFEQTCTGDRPPHETLLGVLDASHVRGHDMRMQQRVSRPTGAMVERCGDDPITREQSPIASTRAGEHGSVLVVADDLIDRLAMRLTDLSPSLVVREGPQDAHALGRTQSQVIAGPEAGLTSSRDEPIQFIARHGPCVATHSTATLMASPEEIRRRLGHHVTLTRRLLEAVADTARPLRATGARTGARHRGMTPLGPFRDQAPESSG